MTKKIIVTGVVQGVGFRPFVYKRAQALGITGSVCNTARCVEIIAQGSESAIAALADSLRTGAPPQSLVERVVVEELTGQPRFASFTIEPSRTGGERVMRISRDLALCPDCRRELFDPHDRRYLYPYINCTNCGPRFTIVRDIPYDRVNTTMASFPMCPVCEREYRDPADRRFHAQPNACHVCGPRVRLESAQGEILVAGTDSRSMEDLARRAAVLLAGGAILGIKGLGGFHIACRADDEATVAKLRARKRREEKPLAVMVRDPEAARRIVSLDRAQEARLCAIDAPILLLSKAAGNGLAEKVAPSSTTFGLMLPYTPLQHILFAHIDFPLVMTSANFSAEPIVAKDDEAQSSLAGICDNFIFGEREIDARADDSVLRLFRGKDYLARRSRGFVPTPVLLNRRFDKPVLAVGAELKNTICVATGEAAYLSQHIGDLENRETYRVFLETIRRFLKILDLRPALIAHDLHPAYLSTQFVLDPPPDFDWVLESLKMPVQHHHAHVAACLAEKGLRGKVIGVTLDGTGYGEDGTIWGGEVLVADLVSAERCAHLEQVTLPGGDLAIREPWRMALAYIQAVFGDAWRNHLPPALKRISEQKLIVTMAQVQSSTLLPLTSSCGRLFDALAALSGVCLAAAYEGQPAIEFEQALEPGTGDCYPFTLEDRSGTIVIGWREMIRAAVRDLQAGKAASLVSDRFHRGLIEALTGTVTTIAARTGIRDVVLTGGCFMNMTLLEGMINKISGAGLNPVIHERVPCNDGGIALGQAAVAAARTG